MKHNVITDSDKYVIGLDLVTEGGVEVPEEVFNSSFLTCYKYTNKKFVFDEAKKERMETQKANQDEIERLIAELKDYDYIGTKIAMGVATKEDYAEEIAYTETLRQRIRELE